MSEIQATIDVFESLGNLIINKKNLKKSPLIKRRSSAYVCKNLGARKILWVD